ncbi:MAG: outer membrane protein assembly factor BamA, partial [SAR202 cluster bacterium]|nr:outer membrane protein assembly factor BamA [SAR202 cluster bacterium]
IETEKDFTWSNWLELDREKALLNKESTKEIAKQYKLSPGNIFNKKKLFDMTEDIKAQYTASGFFNVEIIETLETDSQNRIDIQLDVNQGKRAKVESISITGSKAFNEEKLLEQFSLDGTQNSFINLFFPKDKYTDLDFNQSIESLNAFYMNSGYLDFKIANINKTLSDNQEKINIEIVVSEGIQYKLGNVSFSGELGNQNVEKLMDILTIKKGDIFNWQEVVSDVQKITNVFVDQGYAFANTNPTTEDVLDTVNIYFDITLNKKVYVNRITISGNTRTQDEVIRREIGLSEGSLYSRNELKKSVLKLRRLGYFSDVQMEVSKVEGKPDKIDLNFTLEETKTGVLSFTLSHSNNYGVSFGAGVKEKNIFGSGNTFNAELMISEPFRKISFYFMNPHINNNNHSISYGAFYSKQTDDDIMTNSYTINTKGLNLGYGIPLTEDARINTILQYADNEVLCSSGF